VHICGARKGFFQRGVCFGKHVKRRSHLRNVKDFMRKKKTPPPFEGEKFAAIQPIS